MKTLFLTLVILLASSFKTNYESASILTTPECGDCKERIESVLNSTKGIKWAELDLKTKRVEVKFNPKKITLEKIRIVITKIGYGADEMKANQEAYNKLPKCCQAGGHDIKHN
jgi:mercuric ion binding protein